MWQCLQGPLCTQDKARNHHILKAGKKHIVIKDRVCTVGQPKEVRSNVSFKAPGTFACPRKSQGNSHAQVKARD